MPFGGLETASLINKNTAPLPIWRLFLLTIAFLGVQFGCKNEINQFGLFQTHIETVLVLIFGYISFFFLLSFIKQLQINQTSLGSWNIKYPFFQNTFERKLFSLLQFHCKNKSNAGAVQIAFTTPLFLALGIPDWAVNFVWIAGPVSGLVVQPIVGVISDRWVEYWLRKKWNDVLLKMNLNFFSKFQIQRNTSRFGRRRPFIFFGSIFISKFLFCWKPKIKKK